MTKTISNKLYAISVILALVVLVSTSCSRPKDSQTNGEGIAEKQPVKSQDETSTRQPETQEADKDSAPQQVADTVYTGGKIYTINEEQPWAEAVAIKDGKFIKVGSEDDVKPLIGDATETHDLGGQLVLPGFVEPHTHPLEDFHKQLFQLKLDTSSQENLLKSVKDYAEANPDKEWIVGGMWPIGMFPGNSPDRKLLDEVVPDRPVFLIDQSAHSCWVNTKALELAGLMKVDVELPKGSVVERDGDGKPSGTIREYAIGYVRRFMPPFPLNEWAETGLHVQTVFHELGFTSTRVAAVAEDHLKAIKSLDDRGELKLRLSCAMPENYFDSATSSEEQVALIGRSDKYATKHVHPDAVKMWTDGTQVEKGAWLTKKYPGTDSVGTAYFTPEQLVEKHIKYQEMGKSVMSHACGDRAVHEVLNAIAAAKKALPDSKVRHQPTHCIQIAPEDLPRFAKLGVAAEFSPQFMFAPGFLDSMTQTLGRESVEAMYPARDVLDAGGVVAIGSDYAVTPLDPWSKIQWLVRHQHPDHPTMEVLAPNRRLSVAEAIRAYTFGGAYAIGRDHEVGTIEVGKYADFIVLNQNLFDLEEAKRTDLISKTQPTKTIFEGEIVFDVAAYNPKPKESADTVYTNGKIYTVNEAAPWAEAAAIKDGKFIKVGSADDVKPLISDETEVVDLGGNMVMPGMMDLHHHLLTVSDGRSHLGLKNSGDKDAMLKEIKAYADANPDLPLIRGEQWDLGVFAKDSPRKELLDAIVPDRPAYFMSQTGHSAWINSKALEMAGITKDTPVTSKFIYDKDPETGEPSGTIREFAMAAVLQKLPRTPPEKMAPQVAELSRTFTKAGFTSLKLADGRPHHVKGAVLAESQGKLTTRLFPSWEWRSHYNGFTDAEMVKVMDNWKDYKTELIDPRHVKIFADGTLDSFTSLLYEDYEGRPGFKGTTHWPKEELLKAITEFNSKGLGVIIHTMGDATAGQVIDIFAEVRKKNGNNDAPLHLSHAWLATPADLKRLAKLEGVTVDFSPALSYPHPSIRGSFVPPIGEERYQKFFNTRSAFEAGLPVGFGTDYPSQLIPEPNGFHDIQSWMTRSNPEDPTSGTLNADQAISLEQAIKGHTLNAAKSLGFGWDKKLGSIEAGKLADFIVLDQNLFDLEKAGRIDRIYKTKVLKTVLQGKVVYDALSKADDDEQAAAEIKADTVYTNGKIYTVNEKQPWAEAVAVDGNKIVFVGSSGDAKKHIGDETKVFDLNGKMLLPGFIDSHFHPVAGSMVDVGASLQYDTVDEVLKAVKEYADAHPDEEVIRGFGWRYALFPPTGPTKDLLDKIVPDRPVVLFAIDAHGGWANSKALEMAGITKETPDPQPGFSSYQRDPETKEATGYLVETPAAFAVLSAIQPQTKDRMAKSLEQLMPKFAAAGLTACYDAGIVGVEPEEDGWNVYFEMEKRGELAMRIVGSLYHNNPKIDPIPVIKSHRKRFQSELVQASILKVTIDGGDAQHTGAYLLPYADKPETAGDPIFTQEELNDIFIRADAAGIDIHSHAFGDRAVRMHLDAVEAAIKANPERDRRHSTGHTMYIHDDDVPRFAKLGVLANFSANWATPDSANLGIAVTRLGERVVYSEFMRMRSVIDAGGKVCFGSDYPAAGYYSTFKPLESIQVAVTRSMINGKGLAEVMPPEKEKVTLEQALTAQTLNSAYMINMDKKIGSIEVGKLADLVVLEKNLFDVKPMEISEVRVLMTMMNGKVTHQDDLD